MIINQNIKRAKTMICTEKKMCSISINYVFIKMYELFYTIYKGNLYIFIYGFDKMKN